MKPKHALCLTAAALLACLSTAGAQEKTAGFNYKIPEKVMTPDTVETRLGTLQFFDGMPDATTVERLYDNPDLMRGVERSSTVSATSVEGLRLAHVEQGLTTSHQALIFDKLLDSAPLMLTGNTDTVYCSVILDLQKDGPTVVEIPAGSGPGTVNDAYFRFVTDMGAPGPDRGKGGKYLILPPDYAGDLHPPAGGMEAVIEGEKYFVSRSTSYVNWLILRGFLVDGKPDAASAMFRNNLKVYPLSMKSRPPKMEFTNGSRKFFNTIHANDFEFYEELHTVIEREPVSAFDPELRGTFAAIGIEKGKSRTGCADEKILTEAVAIGNATARAIIFVHVLPRPPSTQTARDECLHRWRLPVAGERRQGRSQPGRAPCSSTRPRSTRRPWCRRWSVPDRNTPMR